MTGFFSLSLSTASWISCDGATPPPGLSIRSTTALTAGSSACRSSSSTMSRLSSIVPMTLTTPTPSPHVTSWSMERETIMANRTRAPTPRTTTPAQPRRTALRVFINGSLPPAGRGSLPPPLAEVERQVLVGRRDHDAPDEGAAFFREFRAGRRARLGVAGRSGEDDRCLSADPARRVDLDEAGIGRLRGGIGGENSRRDGRALDDSERFDGAPARSFQHAQHVGMDARQEQLIDQVIAGEADAAGVRDLEIGDRAGEEDHEFARGHRVDPEKLHFGGLHQRVGHHVSLRDRADLDEGDRYRRRNRRRRTPPRGRW